MKNKQRLVAAFKIAMRISFIQIIITALFTCSLYAGEVNGQGVLDKSFNLKVDNAPLHEILTEIQRQTRVKFTFGRQQSTVGNGF